MIDIIKQCAEYRALLSLTRSGIEISVDFRVSVYKDLFCYFLLPASLRRAWPWRHIRGKVHFEAARVVVTETQMCVVMLLIMSVFAFGLRQPQLERVSNKTPERSAFYNLPSNECMHLEGTQNYP